MLDCHFVSSSTQVKTLKLGSATMTVADLITDIAVLAIWIREGHFQWFAIGISIILVSDIYEGCFYQCSLSLYFQPSLFHFSGFGILYELIQWWRDPNSETHGTLFRVTKNFESTLEAEPFMFLQLYVMVVEEDYNQVSITSLVFTSLSVGYVATIHNRMVLFKKAGSQLDFPLVFMLCLVDTILRVIFGTSFQSFHHFCKNMHRFYRYDNWRPDRCLSLPG